MESEVLTESVLNSIKTLMGIDAEITDFDVELLIHINSAIGTLYEVGVVHYPLTQIVNANQTYEVLFDDPSEWAMAKTYIYYKVKLGFDSANASSYLMEVWRKEADELLWRLQVYAEHRDSFQ